MRGSVLGLVMGGYAIVRCLAPAEAAAGGAGQTQIAVDCRLPEQADGLTPDVLCAAMVQSLEAMAPGARITQQPEAAALMLVVQVTGTGPRGLTGHLWWDSARSADPQSGPEVQFRLIDAALDGVKLRGFTDALLTSDPRLLPALRGLAE